jgi:anti-anti-sigma regulatory factor
MTIGRPVAVQQLPAKLIGRKVEKFAHESAPLLKTERPHVVFDFSAVEHMDDAAIEWLLDSLAEVMKRNGDLKLAAVPAPAAEILIRSGVDQLFECFAEIEAAVESFRQIPADAFREWEQRTNASEITCEGVA